MILVPREALWTALKMKKLGVPDVLVGIIKSFHTNMRGQGAWGAPGGY